jgi:hypothetical protein
MAHNTPELIRESSTEARKRRSGVWTPSEDNAADDPTRGRAVREAGPMDPAINEYVLAAAGRFERAVEASRCLLAARAEQLPARLLEVLAQRAKRAPRRATRAPDRAAAPSPIIAARPSAGMRSSVL